MSLLKEQIQSITKEEELKKVRTLNLDSLEISTCFPLLLAEMGTTLQILSLKSNNLSEIDIVLGFSNLRKLDLSSNKLVSIGSSKLWSSMPKLQILYLHNNLLENWENLETVSVLPNVQHLTLFNNLVVHLPNYKPFLLSKLQSLLALDFLIVTQEERCGLTVPVVQDSKVSLQETYSMVHFREVLYNLTRKWERRSPAVRIQKTWKRYWVQNNMHNLKTDKDIYAIKIQKIIRGWLERRLLRRELIELLQTDNQEHLLYTPENYLRYKAALCIGKFVKTRFLLRKRRFEVRTAAATKIQTAFRRYIIMKNTVPFLTNLKIYVQKSQLRILICMIKALSKPSEQYHPANSVTDRNAPEFFERIQRSKNDTEFSEVYSKINDCENIKLIRIPDLENIPFSVVPYYMLSSWVFHAKLAGCGKPITDKKIVSFYLDKQYLPVLEKLKKRGCQMSKEEKEKLKDLKVTVDEYLDMTEFEAPSAEFLHKFFLLSVQYNLYAKKQGHPIFLPMFGALVERLKAIGTIQAAWRSYKENKGCAIYEAVLRRATYCIQRWWRSVKFTRRLKFLTELKGLIKKINSPVLYMQEHLFQNLKMTELTSLAIPEQHFNFYCNSDGVFVAHHSERLLPRWVGTRISEDQSGGRFVSPEERTLQSVVLNGAKIEIVHLATEINEKPSIADSNLRFVKVEYKSTREARNRFTVIFLKTLDHSSNSYIPFYTVEALKYPFLMSKLRKIWRARKIDSSRPSPALSILSRALLPSARINIQPMPSTPSESATEEEQSFRDLEVETTHSERPSVSVEKKKRVADVKENTRIRHQKIVTALNIEKINRQITFKEERQAMFELKTQREEREKMEKTLRWSMAQAKREKLKEIQNERVFINKFRQARNMLQKITINSDIQRWRLKNEVDVKNRVDTLKQQNFERRQLIRSIVYEKFLAKQRQASL